MPAGGQKQAIRKADAVGQARGQSMGFQMIDGDQWLVVRERDRLGRRQPDDHAADQAGPGGGRDAIEIAERDLGLGHGLFDDAVERFDMGAGRDFRHHAAEFGMFADL